MSLDQSRHTKNKAKKKKKPTHSEIPEAPRHARGIWCTSLPVGLTPGTHHEYKVTRKQLSLLEDYIEVVTNWASLQGRAPDAHEIREGLLMDDILLYLRTGRNKDAVDLVRAMPDDQRIGLPQWLQEFAWFRINITNWDDANCFANTCWSRWGED